MHKHDIKPLLGKASWNKLLAPFNCWVVKDVFRQSVYEEICSGFLRHKQGADPSGILTNYAAQIKPFTAASAHLVQPLLDTEWLNYVRMKTGLEATLEIDAALHSHPACSTPGWVHNDYNPGWFVRTANRGDIVFSQSEGCDYTGMSLDPERSPVQRMRYISMIYYLLNDGWKQEDGGSTGIYSSRKQHISNPEITIPPVNNSLLIFECTPVSLHAFMGSSKARHSIISWLHRPFENAIKQWPGSQPTYWR